MELIRSIRVDNGRQIGQTANAPLEFDEKGRGVWLRWKVKEHELIPWPAVNRVFVEHPAPAPEPEPEKTPAEPKKTK